MEYIFFIIFGIAILVFILTFVIMINPRVRGKIMSRNIKSIKYMMDESKDDIENISTNLADATKDGVGITTHAIKDGILKNETIYCKHCGKLIDENSKYCKYCGKEQ